MACANSFALVSEWPSVNHFKFGKAISAWAAGAQRPGPVSCIKRIGHEQFRSTESRILNLASRSLFRDNLTQVQGQVGHASAAGEPRWSPSPNPKYFPIRNVKARGQTKGTELKLYDSGNFFWNLTDSAHRQEFER